MKQIIDFKTKGNVIRFFLGENGKQWGDDWNDRPYEHNAGTVYDEFVKDHIDVVIPFEKSVYEPCNGHNNSPYSKEDMIQRKVPCIVIADEYHWDFHQALADEKSIKYYFGDVIPRVPEDEMDAAIERYNTAKANGTLDRDFPRIA